MSASDERMDDETESDEPEAIGDNEIQSEGAAIEPQEADDAAETLDEIPLGLNEAEARALDSLFSGADAAADDLADQAPADSAEPISAESAAETVPLLDSSGNTPADLDVLFKALRQWEAAAADAPGDPRFTPKLTTKERNDLLMIDRGPTVPVVWLDRATMTPVKYAGEKDSWPAPFVAEQPSPPPDRLPPAGLALPVLTVTVRDANKHFFDALDARRDPLLRLMTKIAQEKVDEERWWQTCQDRAINGDW
jgi:hypothetical protein